MKLEQDHNISIIDKPTFSPYDIIRSISTTTEDPFYVMDVGDLIRKHDNWMLKMPNVKPFYAVKCNDSPVILKVLASLGVCFDCASKGEISKVLEVDGVGPERIIFANPAKPMSHIKYAAKVGVDLMTFDNSAELQKIKAYHPKAKLVLRIRSDASVAQCPLGAKFGCDPMMASELLQIAASLNLAVVGVSFHVGSGCQEPDAYSRAIRAVRGVFDEAWSLGMCLSIVDIGGGFMGNTLSDIDEVADVINECILEEFGDLEHVEVIAEPGRYYASSAYTLATAIHSKREVSGKPTMYYINDGVYGSFNCILYDHVVPTPTPLDYCKGEMEVSSIWGPTCDSLDVVCESVKLPKLQVGDVLVFQNMGAYTLPIASCFNGYPTPSVHYFISAHYWKILKNLSVTNGVSCKKHSKSRVIYELRQELVN